MMTAETYAFAEVQQRVGKFSYAAGIGAMHTYIEQAGQKSSNWIARPQLTLSYDFGSVLEIQRLCLRLPTLAVCYVGRGATD